MEVMILLIIVFGVVVYVMIRGAIEEKNRKKK